MLYISLFCILLWYEVYPAPLKLRPNGAIQIYYYYYYYYYLTKQMITDLSLTLCTL